MKFTHILAVILGVSTGSSACHAQFRSTKWGDSIDTVTTAEQIEKDTTLVIDGVQYFVLGDDVSVGNRDVQPFYMFMEEKLFAAGYLVRGYESKWTEDLDLNLSHYKHFFHLLEMKYGDADTENVPAKFDDLLNSDLPFTSQKLEDLKNLWQQENKAYWRVPWRRYALELKSTWEIEETVIDLQFSMTSNKRELPSEDIGNALSFTVTIVYKDSQNWKKGVEWQREQWDASEKREAEREKKALLKGL